MNLKKLPTWKESLKRIGGYTLFTRYLGYLIERRSMRTNNRRGKVEGERLQRKE